jgi:hypothetical protein
LSPTAVRQARVVAGAANKTLQQTGHAIESCRVHCRARVSRLLSWAFGNQENMTSSLLRFSRGFLYGSAVGAALLTFGLVSWGIALITGLKKDDSTHGMSLLPVYVLSFGLGGGVVGMLHAGKSKVKRLEQSARTTMLVQRKKLLMVHPIIAPGKHLS